MKEFKGRIVAPGTVTAEALVSHGGLNTLASFQKALQFGDKKATCGDQNNPDLYNKQMLGKALCLPPLTPSVEEAAQIADTVNRVNTYRDETIGKMIMGQIPLSEFDSFIAEVKKMGLEDAVKIYNDALARYNAR